MSRETEWTLFLDETGDFASDSAVAIAGLLVQHEEGQNLRRVWREAIRSALPAIAYPPHATDLRLPSAHLAEWMAAPPEHRRSHPDAARLADLAQLVREHGEAVPGFEELVEARRKGKTLHGRHRQTVQRCDAFLRSVDPEGYRLLEDLADRFGQVMRGFLRELGRVFGPERCFVVGAAEIFDEAEVGRDRYLELLVPLFERVFGLLRSASGERHKVWVWAESRKVLDSTTGHLVDLRASDLGAAVRRAERFPFLSPQRLPDPRVRLVAATPEKKGGDLHPGLVLADFVANRLRSCVEQDVGYGRIDAAVVSRTGLHPMATSRGLPQAGALPSLAARGPARCWLWAAAGGVLASDGARQERRWMHEQAQAWAEAMGVVR